MGKLKKFLFDDQIQIALGTGLSIIILALFYKKVMHIDVPYLENALPGFVFLTWEGLNGKKKLTKWPWSRPWMWNVLAFAVVALIIAIRLWVV